MGSSVYSPFLLPSLLVCIVPLPLSGRMLLKVIVLLCVVLVGLIDTNPVNMKVTELPDRDLDEASDIGFTTNGYVSEDTTEDSDYEVDGGMDSMLERNKRSPCRILWKYENFDDCIVC